MVLKVARVSACTYVGEDRRVSASLRGIYVGTSSGNEEIKKKCKRILKKKNDLLTLRCL